MENQNDIENFESFRNRISELFKNEGLSAELLAQIDDWHNQRFEENDKPGGTIEDRVKFQIELAKIYIITDRSNLADETLRDALCQANQKGLEALSEEIRNLSKNL